LLYNAARVYARASAGVTAEAGLDGRTTAALREHWEGRAVQLLRQALEAQPAAEAARFWETCVRNDAALQSVRYWSGFRQLADRYGRRGG